MRTRLNGSKMSPFLSLRGRAEAISNNEIPLGVYPERNSEILRYAQNDKKRRARNDILGVFSNEKGIALVMVLILSAISLAIMAGLLYMVVTGTQISGMEKRYKTALEAGMGGIDVTYQVIVARIDNPATLQTNFNFLTNFVVTASQTCLNNKLLNPTGSWPLACSSTLTIDPNTQSTYDMSFVLGTYTTYAKIVDTVEGNSGGDEGLLKHGVVSAGSGEITVMSIPYLYTIEVNAEATTNPAERAKLSILYQY